MGDLRFAAPERCRRRAAPCVCSANSSTHSLLLQLVTAVFLAAAQLLPVGAPASSRALCDSLSSL